MTSRPCRRLSAQPLALFALLDQLPEMTMTRRSCASRIYATKRRDNLQRVKDLANLIKLGRTALRIPTVIMVAYRIDERNGMPFFSLFFSLTVLTRLQCICTVIEKKRETFLCASLSSMQGPMTLASKYIPHVRVHCPAADARKRQP